MEGKKRLKFLLEHFDRASKGAMEMMLVKGFAGVGKTALIMEIETCCGKTRVFYFKQNLTSLCATYLILL